MKCVETQTAMLTIAPKTNRYQEEVRTLVFKGQKATCQFFWRQADMRFYIVHCISGLDCQISTQNIAKKHGRLLVYALRPPQPPNVCRQLVFQSRFNYIWYQYANADIDTASANVWDHNPHYVINTSVLATQPRAQHSNRFYFSIDGSICYSMDKRINYHSSMKHHLSLFSHHRNS